MTTRRCQQLVRTWHLIALLERLSRELGVTTRTVRRDLEALQDAGLALYDEQTEDETHRRWRLVKGASCALCGRSPFTGAELRRDLADRAGGRDMRLAA